MKHTYLMLLLVSLLLIAGCGAPATAPVSDPNSDEPNAPVSSDDPQQPGVPPAPNQEVTGPVDMESTTVELLQMESYPVQYTLLLRGTRPTPCHRIHATYDLPNAQNEIRVTAVYVVDKDQACAQVLDNFEETIQLGSYPTGRTYTVWVNDVQVAEFTP